MKILILFLALVMAPVSVFAATLPSATWNTTTEKFEFQKAVDSKANLSAGDIAGAAAFARWGVNVLLPNSIEGAAGAGGVAAADMTTAAGAGKAFIQRGIGLAGPIASVLAFAITAKVLYDWANSSPEHKAFFDGSSSSGAKQIERLTNYQIGDTALLGSLGEWEFAHLEGTITGLQTATNGASWRWNGPPGGGHIILYKDITGEGPNEIYRTAQYWSVGPAASTAYPNLAAQPLEDFGPKLAEDMATGNLKYPQAENGIKEALKDLEATDPSLVQESPLLRDVMTLADLAAAVDANTEAQQALTDQLAELTKQLQDAKDKAALDPTNPGLQQLVSEIQRALDQTKTQQAATAAQAAEDKAEESAITESTADTLKTIDWAPLLALKGVLSTTFPFNLLVQSTEFVSGLVRSPVAPAFDFPVGFGQTVHVDLAVFDPVAAVCRWVFSLGMIIGAIFLANAFYRGN